MDKQSVVAFFAELAGITQMQALTYLNLIDLAILQVTAALKEDVIISFYHKQLHFWCASIVFYNYALLINCVRSVNPDINAYTAKEKLQLIDTAHKIRVEAFLAVKKVIKDDWFAMMQIVS